MSTRPVLTSAENLTLAALVHVDVQKLPIVKLPRVAVDCLYLNRHMSATLTRRDDVVTRDAPAKGVASKPRRHSSAATKNSPTASVSLVARPVAMLESYRSTPGTV